jgi:transposase-like protein
MTDTEVVPHKPKRTAEKPPLVDEATADELLAKAQAEGVELLGPLLSQVTKAVLDRALDEELTGHLGYEKRGAARDVRTSSPRLPNQKDSGTQTLAWRCWM